MVKNLSRKLLGIALFSVLSVWSLLSFNLHLGLDLSGGARIVYSFDFVKALRVDKVIDENDYANRAQLLQQIADIFRLRLDATGLADIPIYPQGDNALVIELPDRTEAEVEDIKRTISNQGLLDFRIIADTADSVSLGTETQKWQTWVAANPDGTPTDFNRLAENEGGPRPEIRWYAADNSKGSDAQQTLARYIVDGAIPLLMLDAVRPEFAGVDSWEFSGADLKYAGGRLGEMGFPVVAFELYGHRKSEFTEFTGFYKNRPMAIVLNNKVFSAPNINEALPGGGQIGGGTGGFSQQQVNELVTVLRTGSLPILPQLESESFVGSTLGEDAIATGKKSALLGGVLVLLFMLFYYRMNGVVACAALLFNAFILMGALYFTQATLTLPGLAGLVLTIGMAVDANILIFERVREEWKRGREIPQAYKNGYERAFWTIIDANVTTLIAGVILWKFGTGPVQGFAATLCLGILTTLFSALIFSKVLMSAIVFGKNPPQKVSMGQILAGAKQIDFLGKRKLAGIVSVVLIIVGLVVFGRVADDMLGIDFAGGSTARVELAQTVSIGDVRKALPEFQVTIIKSSMEAAAGDSSNSFQVKRKLSAEQREASKEEERISLLSVAELDKLSSDLTPEEQAAASAERLTQKDLATVMIEELAVKLEPWLWKLEDGSVDLDKSFPEKSTVGARVSGEIQSAAVRAILLSLMLIVVYMTFRFREYRYGFAAVAALFHDVLITLGALAVAYSLGVHVEINLEIIAAFLTIIGYSLNDTIVVFDRIRENLPRRKEGFSEVINISINQSLSRTILTSVTTFFVVAVLFIFNRPFHNSLEGFSFAMLVGIIVGTYSSMFIASPLLVFFDRWARKHRVEEVKESGKAKAVQG
jgi:SecD/SecF fusion protein